MRVILSVENKCVFGREIMLTLQVLDEEMSDPIQSDVDFNEKEAVTEFLEASFDRAKLEDLPKECEPKYRKLVM